jgi:dihydroorotate dehydrogenase electron transfer subunit
MSTPPRQQLISQVKINTQICRDHFRLILQVDRFPPTFPGQFIQILCRDFPAQDHTREVDWTTDSALCMPGALPGAGQAMLRRPFSLAGRHDRDGAVELEIIHRVVGVGTAWLSRLTEGAPVSILGPLGTSFSLPASGQGAILVGGGVGIPPMLYLASQLADRAVAFCGATTCDLLPLSRLHDSDGANDRRQRQAQPTLMIEEFARHGIQSVITTDDGSLGFKGLVTEALEQYLQSLEMDSRAQRPVIYTCGPEPMMKRVAAIALGRGIACQIAVERAMACGMGTCQSCCIRVRKADPAQPPMAGSEWCYRLACTDGPIFRAADLLW